MRLARLGRAAAALALLLAAACGGDDSDDAGDDEAPGTTEAETAASDGEDTTSTTEEEAPDDGPALDPTSVDVCALLTVQQVEQVAGISDVRVGTAEEIPGGRSCTLFNAGNGAIVGAGPLRGEDWKQAAPGCSVEDIEIEGREAVSTTCAPFAGVRFPVRGIVIAVLVPLGGVGDAEAVDPADAVAQAEELAPFALDNVLAL